MTIRKDQPPHAEMFLGGLMILSVFVIFMWIFGNGPFRDTPTELDCPPSSTYIE